MFKRVFKPKHILIMCNVLLVFLNVEIRAMPESGKVGDFLKMKIEVLESSTRSSVEGVTIDETPLSIFCNKTNTDNISLYKYADDFLYFLSSNELMAIDINEQRQIQTYFVATLQQVGEKVLDMQVGTWQNIIVIVLQFSKTIHVYLTPKDFRMNKSLIPYQKFNTNGPDNRFVLFSNKQRLLLVTQELNKANENELIFYNWENSFFSQKSIETIDTPTKSDLFVFNGANQSPLFLSVGSGNTTRLVTLKLDLATGRFTKLQVLYFEKYSLQHYIIKGQLYLIGCSTDSYCAIYKWNNGQFRRRQKIRREFLNTVKRIFFHNDIVVVEKCEKKLSLVLNDDLTNPDTSFSVLPDSPTDDFAIFKSPLLQQLFLVHFALKKTDLAVNFYSLSLHKTNANMERSDSNLDDPKECTKQLKLRLKSRMPQIQSVQQLVRSPYYRAQFKTLNTEEQLVAAQEKSFNIEKKKTIKARQTELKDSKLCTIKMPYDIKVTAQQLNAQILKLSSLITEANETLEMRRTPTEARADEQSDELDNIIIKNLVHTTSDNIIQDVQLKTSKTFTFSEEIRLRNISAKKLVIKENSINHIELGQLLNTTSTRTVTGKKFFQHVAVDNLRASAINNGKLKFLESSGKPIELSTGYEFQGKINVKNLIVKTINELDVKSVFDNAFLVNARNVIQGDLVIQNVTNVNELIASHLINMPTSDAMTTSTDQTVSTDLFVRRFFASNINTSTVNEENLSQNVALVQAENIVEVPTQFSTIHVLRNLNAQDIVDEGENPQRARTIETMKRHVIGTEESDLMQIYNGVVVIRGSLVIKDAKLMSPKTLLVLNDRVLPENLTSSYWMKNVKQKIQADHFSIRNQASVNGNVFTKFLSGQPLQKFVMLNEAPQGRITARFESAVVQGDVKGTKDNYPSFLFLISRQVVPINGLTTVIKSSVSFRDKLVVRNLNSETLNSMPSSTLITMKNPNVVLRSQKRVKHLALREALVDGSLAVLTYNEVFFEKWFKEALNINQGFILPSLKVKTFGSTTLQTEFFEDNVFATFIENLQKQLVRSGDDLGQRINVKIAGGVTFDSNVNVNTINSENDFNTFLSLLVMKNQASSEVGSRITFKNDVTIENYLECKFLNNISTSHLLDQSLSRSEKQTLTSEFFVKSLKTRSLVAGTLNGVAWNQLIDKTATGLPIIGNFVLGNLTVKNLRTRSASFDFNSIISSLLFPAGVNWNEITAENVDLVIDKSSVLERILKYAVYRVGPPQLIYADVQTLSPRLFMKHLAKLDYTIMTSNKPVNLHKLFYDSLQNSKDVQTINGIVTFLSKIYIKNLRIEPSRQSWLDTNEINGVDIAQLHQAIVRTNDTIFKDKFFKHLHVNYVESNGRFGRVLPQTLIVIANEPKVLAKLNINLLETDHLGAITFNLYSWSHFLQTRMKKNADHDQELSGLLSLNSLRLLSDTVLSSINNIIIDDIVYSESDQLQEIVGHKIVMGNITFQGPSTVENINNYDLANFFKYSISSSQDCIFVRLQLPKVTLNSGIRAKYAINGHHVDDLLTSDTHVPKLRVLTEAMAKIQNEITESYSKKIQPKRLLYIDYDQKVQLSHIGERSNGSQCSENTIEPRFNQIIVRQHDDSEMTVELPSINLKVEPNIYCNPNQLSTNKLNVLWSCEGNPNATFSRSISFESKIADVNFVETKAHSILMIVTLSDDQRLTSEIVVLHLDKDSNDWHEAQRLRMSFIGRTTRVDTADETFLIVSMFDENLSSVEPHVAVLQLNQLTNELVTSQRKLLTGKFDTILGINVSPKTPLTKSKTFLLLTRIKSQEIFIYQFNTSSNEFVFQVKLPVQNEIVEVMVLYMFDLPHFVVRQQKGDFCVYELRGIESWKVKQCGHFTMIDRIRSYEYQMRQHLLLTSSPNSGTALTVYRQGELI